MVAAQTGLLLDIQLLEEDVPSSTDLKSHMDERSTRLVDIELIKKWVGLCENDHMTVYVRRQNSSWPARSSSMAALVVPAVEALDATPTTDNAWR
jgi:hypothetical protein